MNIPDFSGKQKVLIAKRSALLVLCWITQLAQRKHILVIRLTSGDDVFHFQLGDSDFRLLKELLHYGTILSFSIIDYTKMNR